jgi:hypothetical protein
MDWNIFYSTISQTAGAIVGIFSAFLITKKVANQSEFNIDEDTMSQFIEISQYLVEECKNRKFDLYNKIIEDNEIKKIVKDYDKTNQILSPEEYYNKFNFSQFQPRSELLIIIKRKIEEIQERAQKQSFEKPTITLPLNSTELYSGEIEIAKLARNERELIDNLSLRIKHQINLNNNILIKLRNNNQSSKLITVSILVVLLLFFIGVIYPLSFLPLNLNQNITLSFKAFFDNLFSLKGVILLIISLTFSSLMLIFLYVNFTLKYNEKYIYKLKKYTKIENYSTYFKTYIENCNNQNNSL